MLSYTLKVFTICRLIQLMFDWGRELTKTLWYSAGLLIVGVLLSSEWIPAMTAFSSNYFKSHLEGSDTLYGQCVWVCICKVDISTGRRLYTKRNMACVPCRVMLSVKQYVDTLDWHSKASIIIHLTQFPLTLSHSPPISKRLLITMSLLAYCLHLEFSPLCCQHASCSLRPNNSNTSSSI